MPSSPLCKLTSASEEAPRRRIAAAKRSLFIFAVRSLSRTAKTGRYSSSPPLRQKKSRSILLRLRTESHRFVPLSPLSPSLPVPPPQRRQRTATSPLRLRGSPFTCVCRKWRYSRTGWLEGSRGLLPPNGLCLLQWRSREEESSMRNVIFPRQHQRIEFD